jgi:membrane-associated phospholipid phosphatase
LAEPGKHKKNSNDNDIEEEASKSTTRRRARLFQVYVFAAVIGFVLLAFFANRIAYFPIDLLITRTVQTFHPAWFVDFMIWVSWPGYLPEAYLFVIAAFGLLFFSGFRWEAITTVGVVIGQTILNAAIKLLIHRPRPQATLVHVMQILHSYSFPSGHVMFYTVFFGYLIFILYSKLKASRLRSTLLLLFSGLLGLIGVSRIYLGEHWASDVLGAYLLGSLCLLGAIQVYRWREDRILHQSYEAKDKNNPG